MAEGYYISADDWPDFVELLRAWRSGRLNRGADSSPGLDLGDPPLRAAVLYGDANATDPVPAELLRLESTLTVWDVDVLGWPPVASGVMVGLKVGAVDLPPFPLEATAEIVHQTLKPRFPALVDVTLGSRAGVHPGRWRLSVAATDPPLVVAPSPVPPPPGVALRWVQHVRRVRHVGTGMIVPMHCLLPVDSPSPLRRGAQVLAVFARGLGWVIVSAEPRKYPFGNYGGGSIS